MEAYAVAELGYVVISRLVRILVRRMQSDTQVRADYNKTDIVTQSEPRPQGYLVQQTRKLELSAGPFLVAPQKPNVTRVHKQGRIQTAHNLKTQLHIPLQLDIPCLIQIGRRVIALLMVTSRPEGTNRERPNAICSSDIKLLAIRHHAGVPIGIADSAHKAKGELGAFGQPAVNNHFRGQLQKLGIGIPENLFALAPVVAENPLRGGKQIPRGGYRVLPIETVRIAESRSPVIGIRV